MLLFVNYFNTAQLVGVGLSNSIRSSSTVASFVFYLKQQLRHLQDVYVVMQILLDASRLVPLHTLTENLVCRIAVMPTLPYRISNSFLQVWNSWNHLYQTNKIIIQGESPY